MAHVIEHFGEQAKALDVTADGLVAYAQRRREAGAASATVKNELTALRRAFNLAVLAGRLPQHEERRAANAPVQGAPGARGGDRRPSRADLDG